jgi:1-acyl-sn-glycerol-3-phosphate acyltransferase
MLPALADLWYDATFWVSGTALTLVSSLRTEGAHHVPRTGPTLLIGNHQSVLDPVLMGLAARRRLSYLARKTLFDHSRLFSRLMLSLNAVPVDQEGTGLEGLRQMLHLLRAGRAVMMFPEGERTWTGAVQPLKPGVSLLIKRVPAPIVPVGIAGAFDAWPRTRTLPRPAPLFLPAGRASIAVSVGRPLDPRRFVGLPRDAVLSELAQVLRKAKERAEHLRGR